MGCINNDNVRLQFISHYNDRYTYLDGIRLALEGGCKWIQLRMKDATTDDIRPVAIEAKKMCQEAGATFVIDDNVELVKELDVDGVHLGKNDMPISEARRILGDKFIIGGTANTLDDVKAHYEAGADYIGCGPFRFTTTKKGLSPVLGLEGYRAIVDGMKSLGINLPIVAIGGITPADISEILATGVTGIALSGTILNADAPVAVTQEIVNKINNN